MYGNVGLTLAPSHEQLPHWQSVVSLSIGNTLTGVHLNWPTWLHVLSLVVDPPVNTLPAECFPLTTDLNGYKFIVNRHLLSLSSL